MYDGVGFDHCVGHFRPPGLVDELPNPRVLQGLRCFYLGRRLLGWPPPCSRPWGVDSMQAETWAMAGSYTLLARQFRVF